jgi:hypothetical protein
MSNGTVRTLDRYIGQEELKARVRGLMETSAKFPTALPNVIVTNRRSITQEQEQKGGHYV